MLTPTFKGREGAKAPTMEGISKPKAAADTLNLILSQFLIDSNTNEVDYYYIRSCLEISTD